MFPDRNVDKRRWQDRLHKTAVFKQEGQKEKEKKKKKREGGERQP